MTRGARISVDLCSYSIMQQTNCHTVYFFNESTTFFLFFVLLFLLFGNFIFFSENVLSLFVYLWWTFTAVFNFNVRWVLFYKPSGFFFIPPVHFLLYIYSLLLYFIILTNKKLNMNNLTPTFTLSTDTSHYCPAL